MADTQQQAEAVATDKNMDGHGDNVEGRGTVEAVSNYYDCSKTDDWYTKVWGEGNIHFGYFPELAEVADPATAQAFALTTTYEKACEVISTRMCEKIKMDATARVIDLGCGYGKPALDLAKKFGCEVLGLDLSELHVKRGNSMAEKHPNLNLSFVQGDMTKLPSKVDEYKPTVAFTQAAFCHIHHILKDVLKEAYRILPEEGYLLVNDVLSPKKASALTIEYVYKRMSFKMLLSTDQYIEMLKEVGFEVESVEPLTWHFWHSYNILSNRSAKHGMKELSLKYRKTCDSIAMGEYDMVEFVCKKPKLN